MFGKLHNKKQFKSCKNFQKRWDATTTKDGRLRCFGPELQETWANAQKTVPVAHGKDRQETKKTDLSRADAEPDLRLRYNRMAKPHIFMRNQETWRVGEGKRRVLSTFFHFSSSSRSKEWPPFKSSRFSRTQSHCGARLLSQYVFRTPDSPFTSLIAPRSSPLYPFLQHTSNLFIFFIFFFKI